MVENEGDDFTQWTKHLIDVTGLNLYPEAHHINVMLKVMSWKSAKLPIQKPRR
jgi:hypothetical protein